MSDWQVREGNRINDGQGRPIALVRIQSWPMTAEEKAHADLIAAAPDMLKVGNEMYAILHDAANGVTDLGMALMLSKICDRWDAAIAKAKGETP